MNNGGRVESGDDAMQSECAYFLCSLDFNQFNFSLLGWGFGPENRGAAPIPQGKGV
jgi:hypothetical protein